MLARSSGRGAEPVDRRAAVACRARRGRARRRIVELVRGRLTMPGRPPRAALARHPWRRGRRRPTPRCWRSKSEGAVLRGRFTPRRIAASPRARMVRSRAARAHSSLHAQPPARGDRAGQPGRFHALPVRVAARRRVDAADRHRRSARRRRRARRLRAGGRARGNATSCPRASIATIRRCSTCCASRARSAGRGFWRGRRAASRRRLTRVTPSRCSRANMARLADARGRRRRSDARLSDDARRVLDVLRRRGASFLSDLPPRAKLDDDQTRAGARRAGRRRPGRLRRLRRPARVTRAARRRPRPADARSARRARSPAGGRVDPARPRATTRRHAKRPSRRRRGRCCGATASCSGGCSTREANAPRGAS